jgi:hypothetical protein
MDDDQLQFSVANKQYISKKIYRFLDTLNSVLVVYIQITSFFYSVFLILSAVLACFLADFINNLVHIYIDSNDRYTSLSGPFIATFHTHNIKQRYNYRNIFNMYFFGFCIKFQLPLTPVFLLTLCVILPENESLPFFVIVFWILSSIAEFSHYLCHNSKSVFLIQRVKLIIPKENHKKHHIYDGVNYIF